MAEKWLAWSGPFTAGSRQALNGRQMATLKRAICDNKWLAMLPFLPFVALTETTNGPFMSCLLGMLHWDPFHLRFFHHNSNSMEISFSSNSITGDHIATKFGTCHDSPAVVLCAKHCSDHYISIWMRAKWNFHHIWIAMEKLLVKWAPGALMMRMVFSQYFKRSIIRGMKCRVGSCIATAPAIKAINKSVINENHYL